jgi:hypothetical protein
MIKQVMRESIAGAVAMPISGVKNFHLLLIGVLLAGEKSRDTVDGRKRVQNS